MQPLEPSASLCSTLPELPSHFIDVRDKVQLLRDLAAKSPPAVVVAEGPRGVGKTEVLAQFKRTYPRSLAVFFSARDRTSYLTSTVLSDLLVQLQGLLGIAMQYDNPEPTHDLVLARFRDLKRGTLLAQIQPLHILVDGAYHVPSPYRTVLDELYQLLPMDHPRFRVIVSDNGDGQHQLPHGVVTRTQLLTGFALPQTREFLQDLSPADKEVEDTWTLTEGRPGTIQLIRDVAVERGSLGAALRAQLSEVLELRWRELKLGDLDRRILAVLTLSRSSTQEVALVASICGTTEDYVRGLAARVPHIGCAVENLVRFENDDWAQFVRSKIAPVVHKEVRDRYFSAFSMNPDLLVQHAEAVEIFADDGKSIEGIATLLSPKFLLEQVHRRSAFSPIRAVTTLAASAVAEHNLEVPALNLAMFSLALQELAEPAAVGMEQFRALLSIGKDESARQLLGLARLAEQRLRMLAAFAAHQEARRRPVEREFVDEIASLCARVDFEQIREFREELADDLMYVNPTLAYRSLPDDLGQQTGRATPHDELRVRHVLRTATESGGGSPSAQEAVRDISDPRMRRNALASTALFADTNADEVIKRLGDIENTALRIRLLIGWLERHRHRNDTALATLDGFKWAISSSDHRPYCGDFAGLAIGLIHSDDVSTVRQSISLVDSIEEDLRSGGPSSEFVRLQVRIALAEIQLNLPNEALFRLRRAHEIAATIIDPAVRAHALSRVLISLRQPPLSEETAQSVGTSLRKAADEVFNNCALHYDALHPTIIELSPHYPELARDLCASMNTADRRARAYADLLSGPSPSEATFFERLLVGLDDIEEPYYRDSVIQSAVEKLSEPLSKDQEECLNVILALVDDPLTWTWCASRIIGLVPDDSVSTWICRLGELLRTRVHCSAERGWIASNAVTDLAAVSQPRAIELSDALAAEEPYPSLRARELLLHAGYMTACALATAIRAGQLPVDLAGVEKELLDAFDDSEARCVLAAAMIHAAQDATWERRAIVVDSLWGALSDRAGEGRARLASTLELVGGVCYMLDSDRTMRHVRSLPNSLRDDALVTIAMYVCRPWPPTEPGPPRRVQTNSMSFEGCNRILALIPDASEDGTVAFIVNLICYSDALTREQRRVMEARIRDISSAFPLPGGVPHTGFALLARMHLAHLSEERQADPFKAILGDVQRIPNASDRVYLYSELLSLLPPRTKLQPIRDDACRMALADLGLVTVAEEKARRAMHLAHCGRLGGSRNAPLEHQAIAAVRALPSDTSPREMRDLVDSAYSLDPEFARQLVQQLDSDPARARSRARRLHQLVEELDAKRLDLSEGPVSSQKLWDSGRMWNLIGEYNAGRLLRPPRLLSSVARGAATQTYMRALPYFLWTLRTRVADRYRERLGEVAAAAYGAWVVARGVDKPTRKSSSTVFTIGMHEEAKNELIRWIAEHSGGAVTIVDPHYQPDVIWPLYAIAQSGEAAVTIYCALDESEARSVLARWDEQYAQPLSSLLNRLRIVSLRSTPRGNSSGTQCPIHDRWIVGEKGAISLGGSLNGYKEGQRVTGFTPLDAVSGSGVLQLMLDLERSSDRAVVVRSWDLI